jgi:hypothetical protein
MRAIGKGISIVALAVAAFAVAALLASPVQAGTLRRGSTPTTAGAAGDPGTYLVAFFDVSEDTGAGDNVLRLVNPTRANGNLCAMIYVFDDDEELGECCGCPLSPNKLLPLSVEYNLTSNWEIAGFDTDSGVVKIVSAVPNNPTAACLPSRGCYGGCDPTIAYTPTPNLNGWITHTQMIYGQLDEVSGKPIFDLSEVSLTDNGATDAVEGSYLITQCASNISNGSGYGSCNCGSEAELID